MSLSAGNTQSSLHTSHHRPPTPPLNPHDNPSRRWTSAIPLNTHLESSSTSPQYKERRSFFSDIPISSRLPPLNLHSAGARSFSFKPKLPVLEPSTANMNDMQTFGDSFGDFYDTTFTQSDMSNHESLASLQTYEHHYGGNNPASNSNYVDPQSSLFAGNFRGTALSLGQAHSHTDTQAYNNDNYMPEANAPFQLYRPVAVSQGHAGLSNNIYAPTKVYNNFDFMAQNVQDYANVPQQHVASTPPPRTEHQAFDSSFSSGYTDYELPTQAYNHSTTGHNSSFVGDFASGSSHLPGSHNSAEQTIDHDIEDVTSPSPQVKKRKIAKARSHSSKSSTSAPSTESSASPRTKNKAGLFFNGFAEAEAVAYNRTPPTLRHDDWSEVKASPTKHVQKLLSAFSDDYADAPEHFPLTKAADKTRWVAYQDGHVDKMSKYDEQTLEAACWVLLKHLIEAHEVGMKTLRYHKIEGNTTCSDHVDMVAAAIRNYAVIRYDVVRLQRLDELVCCTTSAVSRKIANFKGNWNKTERENENQQKAEQLGIDYTPVLGDKKRKAAEASAAPKPARKRVRSAATAGIDVTAGPSTTIKQQRKDSTSSEDIPLQKTIAEMVRETTEATHTPVLNPVAVRLGFVRADTDPCASLAFQQPARASSYHY